MRPTYLLELFDKGKYRDSLYRFSEAHIVSKDSTDPTLIQTYHPI